MHRIAQQGEVTIQLETRSSAEYEVASACSTYVHAVILFCSPPSQRQGAEASSVFPGPAARADMWGQPRCCGRDARGSRRGVPRAARLRGRMGTACDLVVSGDWSPCMLSTYKRDYYCPTESPIIA